MERTGRATGIHMEILDEILGMMRWGGEIKPKEQNFLGTHNLLERESFTTKLAAASFLRWISYEFKPGHV